jgi:hypothetical protein
LNADLSFPLIAGAWGEIAKQIQENARELQRQRYELERLKKEGKEQ